MLAIGCKKFTRFVRTKTTQQIRYNVHKIPALLKRYITIVCLVPSSHKFHVPLAFADQFSVLSDSYQYSCRYVLEAGDTPSMRCPLMAVSVPLTESHDIATTGCATKIFAYANSTYTLLRIIPKHMFVPLLVIVFE